MTVCYLVVKTETEALVYPDMWHSQGAELPAPAPFCLPSWRSERLAGCVFLNTR